MKAQGSFCWNLWNRLRPEAQTFTRKSWATERPGDAYHMTAPCENGEGMARAMQNALREAGISPSAVGHINAHATSTQLNDSIETKAIKLVFGDSAKKIKISATKSMDRASSRRGRRD